MIVFYLILLCIIFNWAKKYKDKAIRKLIIVSYNYLVAFTIFLILSNLKQNPIDYQILALNILNSIYMAARGVAFDRGFQQYSDIFYMLGNSQIVEIQIWSIMLVASLSTAITVVTLLLENKITEIKLRYKFNKQKVKILIVGNNNNSLSLIKDILKMDDYKNCVITYYTDENLLNVDGISNVIVKKLDKLLNDNPLIQDSFQGDYYIVLALKNKNDNIEWLGNLTMPIKDDNQIEGKLTAYKELLNRVHITVICNNEQLRFNYWKGFDLDVYMTSEESLVANKLLSKYSPAKVLSEKNDFINGDFKFITNDYSIGIIGFGDLGVEILLSTFENSRFIKEDLSESSFKAMIIDKNMTEIKENFLTDVPYFADNDNISFINTGIGTKRFYDEVKRRLNELDQIFISTGDNIINIQTALKLSHFIRNEKDNQKKYYDDIFIQETKYPQIIIFIRGENYILDPLLKDNNMLKVICVCDDIYTFDNLIEKSADSIARKVHEEYLELSNGEGEKWIHLDNFLKDGNRASARDKSNKLHLLNLELDKGGSLIDKRTNIKVKSMKINKETFECLAIYEHYRWCGFLYSHGWTKLSTDKLTDYYPRDNGRSDKELRKHICLTDWNTLAKLPRQKNYDKFQNNNRESVKTILANEIEI